MLPIVVLLGLQYADIMMSNSQDSGEKSTKADEDRGSASSSSPSQMSSDELGFEPESKYLEHKLNQEVLSFSDSSHRENLQLAATAFRKMMSEHFPEVPVRITGSFPAGVDLEGSDLDFSVVLKNERGLKSKELLEQLKDGIRKIGGAEFVEMEVVDARVPVLQMSHIGTGVSIDVGCNSETPIRNTQLLVWYGQVDTRFPLLCRAVKRWAAHTGVKNARDGRLNSFSVCLLVLHFLQTRAKILPNLQEVFPELQGEFEVEDDGYERRNLREEMEAMGIRRDAVEVGVGTLFVAFLKYYAEFDFTNSWISIRHGKAMEKPFDGMPESSQLLCIQDPFLKPSWNCAGSVQDPDTFRRLILEFELSFQRVLNEKSIFTMGQRSEWRRRVDLEGKKRDEQVVKWLRELEKMGKRDLYVKRKLVDLYYGINLHEASYHYDKETRYPRKSKEEGEMVPWPEMKKEFL